MTKANEFIRFAGTLFFSPEQNTWGEMTVARQEQYCLMAQRAGWDKLFFRTLNQRLPAVFYSKFRKAYLKESLKQMLEQKQLTDFYALLEKEKISFLPFKGADLAFRIYPDSNLRPHCDWDILFRPDDCPKVLSLLQKQNWRTFSGFDSEKAPSLYHYERMYKNAQSIEVHRTLPCFTNVSPQEIWQETIPLNEHHRVLTPEMNLLLLAAHASMYHYTHLSEWRILSDAGYILKHDDVDWEKVHQLADRWKMLRPDILFSGWSEFFPPGMLPPECLRPEYSQLIRETFALRSQLASFPHYAKVLNAPEKHDPAWFLQKIQACFNPRAICIKYHLTPQSPLKILFRSCCDILGKSIFFLRYIKKSDSALLRYYQCVKTIEMLVKK